MPRAPITPAVVDFVQAIGRLVRRARAAAASHGLSFGEAAVLARLDREGPATAADLARAESVRPQSMGAIVAALEKRQLVHRRAHATDGRQREVVLTAKGASVRRRASDAKHAWLAELVAGLDNRDRETLFRAGAIIRRLVEK